MAVLLPFASQTPDGIEELTQTSDQQQPIWQGIMGDYSVALSNPYVSTLVAGLLGVGIVVIASVGLSQAMGRKKKTQALTKN